MKRKAHKRDLEKSTRLDEENKNRTTGKIIWCKLCVMFTDLSGMI